MSPEARVTRIFRRPGRWRSRLRGEGGFGLREMPILAHSNVSAAVRLCVGWWRWYARAMNRTDRLMAMVTYLQGRRVVRAEELARHFEVSERTVYRDVVALGEAGVPVVGEAGVGYSLVKGYHLPPVMFTAEEAVALAVGEDLVKQFTDSSLAGPMATALLKIRSVLPRDRQDDLDRLTASTAIEGRVRAEDEPDQRLLMPIQQALVGRRVLRATYRSLRQERSIREIEPLGVFFCSDAWYLVCWCRLRQAYRHLKLIRIEHLEVLPERFQPRPDFNLEAHLRAERSAFPMTEVKLWVAATAVERARRESYGGVLHETPAADGGHWLTLRTSSLEWLSRWVLSFGTEAEVLEPAEIRQRVAEHARDVLEKYAEPIFS